MKLVEFQGFLVFMKGRTYSGFGCLFLVDGFFIFIVSEWGERLVWRGIGLLGVGGSWGILVFLDGEIQNVF